MCVVDFEFLPIVRKWERFRLQTRAYQMERWVKKVPDVVPLVSKDLWMRNWFEVSTIAGAAIQMRYQSDHPLSTAVQQVTMTLDNSSSSVAFAPVVL